MWQHYAATSLKTLFINNPTCFDPLRPSSGISSFIFSLSCYYSILKMFKIFIKINEEIPDDGLKGSKHVGLFIKSFLSDFSVT